MNLPNSWANQCNVSVMHRLCVYQIYGGSVVTRDGSEARYTVTRSLTPKDYKMPNYDNVDPIKKLKLHLGVWVRAWAYWSLGDPISQIIHYLRPCPGGGLLQYLCKGPVVQVSVAPTHHPGAVVSLTPESPWVMYRTSGECSLEKMKDLQENS